MSLLCNTVFLLNMVFAHILPRENCTMHFLWKIHAKTYTQQQNTLSYNVLFRKTRWFRKMRDFFLSRLSITNTFVVVFTLSYSISLNVVFAHILLREISTVHSLWKICAQTYTQHQSTESQRVVIEKQDNFAECVISSRRD